MRVTVNINEDDLKRLARDMSTSRIHNPIVCLVLNEYGGVQVYADRNPKGVVLARLGRTGRVDYPTDLISPKDQAIIEAIVQQPTLSPS